MGRMQSAAPFYVHGTRPFPVTVAGFWIWTEFDARSERLQNAIARSRPELSKLDRTYVLLHNEISPSDFWAPVWSSVSSPTSPTPTQ